MRGMKDKSHLKQKGSVSLNPCKYDFLFIVMKIIFGIDNTKIWKPIKYLITSNNHVTIR